MGEPLRTVLTPLILACVGALFLIGITQPVAAQIVPPNALERTGYTPSPRSISLSWDDNSDNETHFNLELSHDGGTTWGGLGQVGSGTTTFSGTLPAGETLLFFRVLATDGTDFSTPSNIISVEGTDPATTDTDGDGMLDLFEMLNGLDPYFDDAYEDTDGDRYPNVFEYARGSDVTDPNSVPEADYIADGGSSPTGNVFSTIQGALDQVAADHRIVRVRDGVYSGSGNVNLSMSNTYSVLLIGENGARSTIVDGGGTARLVTASGESVIDGLTFRNGAATDGGAAYVGGGNLLVVNCVFSGNQAIQDGGALYQAGGSTLVVHSTFLDNSAGGEGASVFVNSGDTGIAKSIFWSTGTNSEIAMSGSGAVVDVTESIVRGGFTGTGNLSSDPLTRIDGHLTVDSPAIDSGGILQTALLDMDGEERPVGTTTDMGADEWLDTDTDDLPDWWELDRFGSLSASPSGDPDGDSLTNLQEYEAEGDPEHYYDQGGTIISPTVTIVSGSGQVGNPSTFATAPLIVQVASGTTPLVNAPLVFTVTGSGGGQIAINTSGTGLTSSLPLVTGTNGQAQVYFRYPATYGTLTSIEAEAGSSQVVFTATSAEISLDGLAMWLKADTGVTVDGSNGVSTWTDQSGNGKNLTQSTTNQRPVLQSNVLGGKPAVRFDGSNDNLSISTSSGWGSSQFSVSFFLKPQTNISYNQLLGATGKWGQFLFHVDSAGGAYVGTTVGTRMTPGNGAGQIPNGTITQGQWHCFTFTYESGTGKFYKDASLIATKAVGAPSTWSGFALGNTVSETLSGDVGEVMVYSRTLNIADVQNLQYYIGKKYSVDSDTDGMADSWELEWFGDLDESSGGDFDEDGVTNLQEYQQGGNPTDFYSQGGTTIVPSLNIVDGNIQTGNPSTFSAEPMIVRVTSGTTPISNAPVTFTVSGSIGQIATGTSGSGLSSTLLVRTGSNGEAQVWYKYPAQYGESCVVQVSTGTASTHFKATSAIVPVNGLALWLKADTGITLDGSGNVSTWADQSGNGKNLNQASSSHRPALLGNILNGRPVVRFDGTNDHISVSNASGWGTSQFTTIFFLKPDTNIDYNQAIASTGGWGQFFFHGNAAGGVYVGTSVYTRMVPGTGAGEIPNGTLAPDEWHAFSFTFDNGLGRFYRDGYQIAEKTVGPTSPWSGFLIGQNGTGTLFGDLAEVFVFSRAVTPSEMAELRTYLLRKYYADTDTDGLADVWEMEWFGDLDEAAAGDFDSDGLNNAGEMAWGSDPTEVDTDDDDATDGAEIGAGTDPNRPDTDRDGMPDGYEIDNGLNGAEDDGLLDEDGDGIPNLWEFAKGTEAGDDGSATPDWVVDPANAAASGSDNILATIAAAIGEVPVDNGDLAASYKSILVKAGVYAEKVTIPSNKRVALVGERGRDAVRVTGTALNDRVMVLAGRCVVDNIAVTRSRSAILAGTVASEGIEGTSTSPWRMVNCLVTGHSGNYGALFMSGGQGGTLDQCTIAGNKSTGTLGNAIDVRSAGGALVINNSILWNPPAGGSTPEVYDTHSRVSIVSSLVRGGQSGGLASDPHLTIAGLLTRGSPAIGQGTAGPAVWRDIDGEVRPTGGASDAGADEYVDTDEDDLPDIWEEKYFADLDETHSGDPDGDGLPNFLEYVFDLNPMDADSDDVGGNDLADALATDLFEKYPPNFGPDRDEDGLTDGWEVFWGTDPLEGDSNGDGIGDLLSVHNGIDPADLDLDGDGVNNSDEIASGTNPFRPDSDHDGHDDDEDWYPNDPALWEAPEEDSLDTTGPVLTLTQPEGVVVAP